VTTEALETIRRQLAFLSELDRLKSVIRQSPLINRTRRENSAEHSWHLAMFALVLSEHVEDVDALHVAKLLLLHDIVEIDAGDAPIHATGRDKAVLAQEERAAAERIFGLLPPAIKVRNFSRCGSNSKRARRQMRALPRPWTAFSRCF
jgi:putative hydrolases of HD superfamily